jgi:hypothetical protein
MPPMGSEPSRRQRAREPPLLSATYRHVRPQMRGLPELGQRSTHRGDRTGLAGKMPFARQQAIRTPTLSLFAGVSPLVCRGDVMTAAGWYAQPEGQKTYWDGRKWTHRWAPGVGSVPWNDNTAASELGAETFHGPSKTVQPSYQGIDAATMDGLRIQAQGIAQRVMVKGLLWFIGGVGASVVAYAATSPGDRTPIFWGAAVFGGYQFLRGVYYVSNPMKLLDKSLPELHQS